MDVETDFIAVIAGPAKELNALAMTDQGRVLILGQFTSINGEPRTQLAWLNQDGTLDTSFAQPTNFRLWTRAAAVQPDGKVVLVGYDQAAEPLREDDDGNIIWYQYQPVVRLNADGSVDTSFDPPTSFEGDYPQAEAIALQPDGKILEVRGGDLGVGAALHGGRPEPEEVREPLVAEGVAAPGVLEGDGVRRVAERGAAIDRRDPHARLVRLPASLGP